ncbi:hypothetical protein [Parasporobacterium paucivorans]|uniref:Uncharacterized protein n=1 Tax=Parasporobacterium paucivorans DSM 15970 TaxID=1122934 RepID=A0A1M6EBC9_9FIRM|nr:hypothetical protein [Parasporobacterium paucivorans]SHI82679.1 hypothetical protein SAMN02745691_00913 [Parasporobacterium paucivorans DSM 15970]
MKEKIEKFIRNSSETTKAAVIATSAVIIVGIVSVSIHAARGNDIEVSALKETTTVATEESVEEVTIVEEAAIQVETTAIVEESSISKTTLQIKNVKKTNSTTANSTEVQTTAMAQMENNNIIEPVAGEPAVAEEPIVEEPVVEEPIVAEEPVVEDPVVEEPVVEDPVVEPGT